MRRKPSPNWTCRSDGRPCEATPALTASGQPFAFRRALAEELVVLFEQLDDGCHIEVSKLFVHGLLEYIPCCADGRYRRDFAGRLHHVGEVLQEKLDWKMQLKIAAQHGFRITGEVSVP